MATSISKRSAFRDSSAISFQQALAQLYTALVAAALPGRFHLGQQPADQVQPGQQILLEGGTFAGA
jgi:hypothetical protein